MAAEQGQCRRRSPPLRYCEGVKMCGTDPTVVSGSTEERLCRAHCPAPLRQMEIPSGNSMTPCPRAHSEVPRHPWIPGEKPAAGEESGVTAGWGQMSRS